MNRKRGREEVEELEIILADHGKNKNLKQEESNDHDRKKRKQSDESSFPLPLPIVHNVKVRYIRPKYQNLKEWMEDDRNVYIGRQGPIFIDGKRFPPKSSIWANPFKISTDSKAPIVVNKFYDYMKNKLEKDPSLVDQLLALSGKNIGCWCVKAPTSSTEPPLVCHGQSIVRLFQEYDPNGKESILK